MTENVSRRCWGLPGGSGASAAVKRTAGSGGRGGGRWRARSPARGGGRAALKEEMAVWAGAKNTEVSKRKHAEIQNV